MSRAVDSGDGADLPGHELGIAIAELRRWIFAPRATPPIAAAAPRRVVCNCFDVSTDAIEAEIRSGQTLPAIQEKLKCGTSCGSCLTEVRRMVGAVKG